MTTVQTIMTPDVVTVSMDDSVAQVRELFHRHGFHHLLVVDSGKAVGLISDRDLLRNISPFVGKVAERAQDAFCLQRKAHQIMTRSLIWIPPETPVRGAMGLMLAHGITCLPILDEHHHIIGIITWRDLLRFALIDRCTEPPDGACSVEDTALLPMAHHIANPRLGQRLIPLETSPEDGVYEQESIWAVQPLPAPTNTPSPAAGLRITRDVV